jgi:spermidine/putrescine transport system substrate-binding protein
MPGRLVFCMLLPAILISEANAHDIRIVQDPWYNDPDFHVSFLKEYGYSPNFRSVPDEEELIDFLTSGADFDVARICSSSLNALVTAGVLQPWDTSKVSVFENIDSRFLYPDAEKRLYLIPFEFGSNLLVYDPESVPKQDASSLAIFHNMAYKDRISVNYDIGSIASLSFLATGVTDWSDATELQTEAALQWWREAHKNIRYYWSDVDVLSQDLVAGKVNIAFATFEISTLIADYNGTAGSTIVAQEGATLWSCGLVRSASSLAPEEQIYDYVNAQFEAPAVRQLLEWGAASTNFSATAELLGDAGMEALGLPPADAKVLIESPLPPGVRDKFIQQKKSLNLAP